MVAPQIRPRPPVRPLRGAAWLGARATLAVRRTRRFARWWLSLGGAATVVALLLPVATPDPDAAARAVVTRRATDTLRTASQLQRARAAVAIADSALDDARQAAQRAARAPAPAPQQSPSVDPRLISLDAAIAMARGARTTSAYLALAADPAVGAGPRMRALADSLSRSFDETTTRRLGSTIIAIAEYRRNEIAESAPNRESATVRPDLVAGQAAAVVAGRASVAAAWRDSVTRAESEHQAALEAMRSDTLLSEGGPSPAPVPSPGLVMLAVLVGVLATRFALALSREAQSPRLAHIEEAEAAVGAPALAVVRDALPEGPMRFKPSGVDPFRVLYLGLTSTGTRARTLVVTGTDPVILGAVGARLAIAASADHRTTLVVDVDPEQITLARIFRAPPEPGFTDAVAGAFRWRDVARLVGSSDGLSITMISAGTSRDAPEPGEELESRRAEFRRFREGFEFTIVIAALRDLEVALSAVPASPIVLCGSIAKSTVEAFTREGESLAAAGQRLHGIVLWDAPQPSLPSRAELAAHLSKQKGRTPGGSFQAVRSAIGKSSSDSKQT